jgi:CheY-like chemotaxis protein
MPNQKTILVIEDNAMLLKSISTKLASEGFNVIQAITAEGGMEKLREGNNIDLLWLDHYLPGEKTGLDLVAEIKADEDLKKIPVFVVTNYDDHSNVFVFMEKTGKMEKPQTYLEYGVEKYFIKTDFALDQIVQEIKKYLKI